MSKQNEQIHSVIAELAEKLDCNFFEACIEFCKDNELDPEDLIHQLDEFTIHRIKQSAIEEHMICKKNSGVTSQQLPF